MLREMEDGVAENKGEVVKDEQKKGLPQWEEQQYQ